ncbi:hypothetical protein ACAW63_16795 [Pseudomonas sp. QE6]|uniref:hypothetical protein n=1 Tax=Pseudomonas sp. QE6 TaxID=3242491 RepID=UPI0035282C8E
MFGVSARVLVLCPHPGRLLIYSSIFNCLGFFRMTLCTDFTEVQRACARQQSSFDLFLLDDFTPDHDELFRLETMNRARAFDQVVLVGNFVEDERYGLFDWAWAKHVGLLDVVEKPLSMTRLRNALDGLVIAPGALHG